MAHARTHAQEKPGRYAESVIIMYIHVAPLYYFTACAAAVGRHRRRNVYLYVYVRESRLTEREIIT